MRTSEGKRLFAIIGLMCICIVIALLFLLFAFDYEEIASNDRSSSSSNLPVTFVFKPIETTNAEEAVQKRQISDELIFQSDRVKRSNRQKRFKRQLVMSPAYYDDRFAATNLRQKRLSEHLHEVKMKFEQCRNSNNADPNECERFFREMVEVHEALNHEIQRLQQSDRNFESQPHGPNGVSVENVGKLSEIPATLGRPMQEFNREGQVLQSAHEFSPFPKFHEELNNHRLSSAWNVPDDSIETSARDNEKVAPLKNLGNLNRCNPRLTFLS